MNDRSDENLVIAARAGDRKAYAALVKKYYRYVFLVCMGMLANTDDAEDIAQDAMLKGFVKINKLRHGSQFRPWITKIAKNMCINLINKKRQHRKAIEQKTAQPDKTTTQDEKLQLAIEKLPQEIRLPLLLYYFDEQNVKNIAEKLNISTAGVYAKLRTATKKLHEILIKQGW